MRLLDNLYCYIWTGRGNNCHSYLVAHVLDGERPHVLIDSGHLVNELRESCFEHLLGIMKKDGIEAQDIGLIINTHSHPDHCEANQALVEITRAKGGRAKRALIALHQDEAEYQRAVGNWLAKMMGREAKFEPDFYLQEGKLSLGQVNLEILHTPGHSPGSISLYCPDNQVLITGDVIFFGAVGRTDFPGGDGRLLKESIERLSQLDVEHLLPGHSTELGHIIRGADRVKQNFAFIKTNYFPFL